MQRAARSQEAASEQPERRTESVASARQTESRNGGREAATEPPGDTGKAFGPEPPPDGTGTPEAKPDDERRLSRASRNVRDSVRNMASARWSRPDATSITMQEHSRCDGTRGGRKRITAAELSRTTPERRSPNSTGRIEGVAWGWWRHRPHLLSRSGARTGWPARHASTSETGQPGAAPSARTRLRSTWRHPWPSWPDCS